MSSLERMSRTSAAPLISSLGESPISRRLPLHEFAWAQLRTSYLNQRYPPLRSSTSSSCSRTGSTGASHDKTEHKQPRPGYLDREDSLPGRVWDQP